MRPSLQTLEELYDAAAALDAELSRSRTLSRDLGVGPRQERVADYAHRIGALEEIARKIGLLPFPATMVDFEHD